MKALVMLVCILISAPAAAQMTPLGAFTRIRSQDPGAGPATNEFNCAGCHNVPITGGQGVIYKAVFFAKRINSYDPPFVLHFSRSNASGQHPPELNPAGNYALSSRLPPTLQGAGMVEDIPDADLLARADPTDANMDGISGRAIMDSRGHVARFGWQPCEGTLDGMVRRALEGEFGVEPAMQDSTDVMLLVDFIRSLPEPRPRVAAGTEMQVARGEQVFSAIGCADCHTLTHTLPSGSQLHPGSDFLVHSMGRGLDDGIGLCGSRSSEWRTAPLWSQIGRPLHDGRSNEVTFFDTIRWHGGEATASANRYLDIDQSPDGAALRAFVTSR